MFSSNVRSVMGECEDYGTIQKLTKHFRVTIICAGAESAPAPVPAPKCGCGCGYGILLIFQVRCGNGCGLDGRIWVLVRTQIK